LLALLHFAFFIDKKPFDVAQDRASNKSRRPNAYTMPNTYPSSTEVEVPSLESKVYLLSFWWIRKIQSSTLSVVRLDVMLPANAMPLNLTSFNLLDTPLVETCTLNPKRLYDFL